MARASAPLTVLLLLALGPGCGGSSSSPSPSPPPPGAATSVVQHHTSARRDGLYVQAGLTRARAATMQVDASFSGAFHGNVYAEPLYVANGPGGTGAFYIVTESNNVYALDEQAGNMRWTQNLGPPAGATGAGCGDIFPLGITGTPYIDLSSPPLYLGAVTGDGASIGDHLSPPLSL